MKDLIDAAIDRIGIILGLAAIVVMLWLVVALLSTGNVCR